MSDMVNNHTEYMYTLRKLEARDIFAASKILSEIGVGKLKECFTAKRIQAFSDPDNVDLSAVGVSFAFDIADIVLSNLPKCEKYVYKLLAGLSGMPEKEIETLPVNVFAEMVIDVVKKEEFRDFMKVVSKLLE